MPPKKLNPFAAIEARRATGGTGGTTVERLPFGWQWAENPDHAPYESQLAVLNSQSPRIACWGAPGNGKTYIFTLLALTLCITYPGYVCIFVRKAASDIKKTLITPTNAHFREVSKKYGLGIKKLPTPEIGWSFANGSTIFVVSGEDEDHIQGGGYDAIFIEELTQLKKAVFQMVFRQGRGSHSLGRKFNYPAKICVNSNPKAGSWVHLEYVKPFFEGKPIPNNFEVHVARTRENTRMLARLMAQGIDYIQDILDAYGPEQGEMLLSGSWDVVEGLVYPPLSAEKKDSPIEKRTTISWEEFQEHYGGVTPDDVVRIGFDHGQNHATAALLAVMRGNVLVVFGEFYEPLGTPGNEKSEKYCVDKIKALMAPADMWRIVWDPNMKPITRAQRAELVHPRAAFIELGFVGHGGGDTKNRVHRVTAMRRALRWSRIKIVALRCPKLFWEWHLNQRAGERFEEPTLADPEAENNHAMDAIEMLVADCAGSMELFGANTPDIPGQTGSAGGDSQASVDTEAVKPKESRGRWVGFDPDDEDDSDSTEQRRGLLRRVGA